MAMDDQKWFSVDPVVEKRDLKAYKEHRVNVVYAQPKIDNKAPKFNPYDYLKTWNLIEDAKRTEEIDKENIALLKNINIIVRCGGKVDCWNRRVTFKSNAESKEPWNRKIRRENKELLDKIRLIKSQYALGDFLRDWKRIEKKGKKMTKYPTTWKEPRFIELEIPGSIPKEPGQLRVQRPRCFFDILIAETNRNLGRIVFELYSDVLPRTCGNFEALCRGEKGLSYKGTPFHLILPGYWCQGGDVTKFNGSGGASIYGDSFEDENFDLRHAGPGVLSMWSSGKDSNNSKFNLTFAKLVTMDGERVVFGRVVRGLGNLYKIEEMGAKSGKPLKTVIVSRCGVLS
ncbi:peptidyl-prolyl cis-trans isomerase E [Orussus abietinus]|uniref:peptidyl-prolyl cis-trans isomerase E n=1 Tax=Orussus abietinus TaxID=222816 RepID=UPI000625EB77|nr:peptidyl-prolyl cis-trans isomerase E [Orussus abietinus]